MEERLKKLEKLKELGVNPYPYNFDRTHTFHQIKDDFATLSQTEQKVSTSCMRNRGLNKDSILI